MGLISAFTYIELLTGCTSSHTGMSRVCLLGKDSAGDYIMFSLVQGALHAVLMAPLEHVGGKMVCRDSCTMPLSCHHQLYPIYKSTESISLERPQRSPSPTINPSPPCPLNHFPQCHIYPFPEHLNTSRYGDHHLPGSLFQCLAALSEKKFFLISNLIFPNTHTSHCVHSWM